MDDDDFYPSQRISHAVEKLSKKEAYIAGSSHCYFYEKTCGISEYGPITSYHASAGTFAFYKEYLDKNKFDDNAEFGEELIFTHHFTNPLIQLDPFKTILIMCHDSNTYDKNKILRDNTSLTLKSFVKDKTEYEFYTNIL